MKFFKIVKHRIWSRYELMRARMRMRHMSDHELIGRYCGIAIIPFTLFVCVGSMQGYVSTRVTDSLVKRHER